MLGLVNAAATLLRVARANFHPRKSSPNDRVPANFSLKLHASLKPRQRAASASSSELKGFGAALESDLPTEAREEIQETA